MANQCHYCEGRNIPGTNHLILDLDGRPGSWIEFCPSCGDKETLRNEETGEEKTVAEVFHMRES